MKEEKRKLMSKCAPSVTDDTMENSAMKAYTKVTEKTSCQLKGLKSETGQKFKGVQVHVMSSFEARKLQVEYMEAAAALTTKSLSETSASAALQHNLDSTKLKKLGSGKQIPTV